MKLYLRNATVTIFWL